MLSVLPEARGTSGQPIHPNGRHPDSLRRVGCIPLYDRVSLPFIARGRPMFTIAFAVPEFGTAR